MLTFDDRLMFAHDQCVLVYERRDNFISDDSILDVALAWTTTNFDDEGDTDDPTDYEQLRDALFDMIATAE